MYHSDRARLQGLSLFSLAHAKHGWALRLEKIEERNIISPPTEQRQSGLHFWRFCIETVWFPSVLSGRKNRLWQSAQTWFPYLPPSVKSDIGVSNSPKSWGIISNFAARISLPCWDLLPSSHCWKAIIHPSIPLSCCVSPFSHFLPASLFQSRHPFNNFTSLVSHLLSSLCPRSL